MQSVLSELLVVAFVLNVDRAHSHLAQYVISIITKLIVNMTLMFLTVIFTASWVCFQDELSDAGRGDSKSTTPLSTAASDVAMASVDTPRTEEAEGLNRNLDSSSAKPDSSKNIRVQDAGATETPSTGESCPSKDSYIVYMVLCVSHQ